MARNIREGDLVDHAYGASGRTYRDRHYWPGLCNNGLRCHLVARAERLAEVWPTDEAFRRFAAEVADAVQAAMASGKRIAQATSAGATSDVRLMCPLGAVFALRGDPDVAVLTPRRFPLLGLGSERHQFVAGFDSYVGVDTTSPYYRLGQAYRRRFVTSGGQS